MAVQETPMSVMMMLVHDGKVGFEQRRGWRRNRSGDQAAVGERAERFLAELPGFCRWLTTVQEAGGSSRSDTITERPGRQRRRPESRSPRREIPNFRVGNWPRASGQAEKLRAGRERGLLLRVSSQGPRRCEPLAKRRKVPTGRRRLQAVGEVGEASQGAASGESVVQPNSRRRNGRRPIRRFYRRRVSYRLRAPAAPSLTHRER